MNADQAAQYDSLIAIKQLFDNNGPVMASMPILTTTATEFSARIAAFEALVVQQDTETAGNTTAKAEARKKVIDLWIPLAAAAYAYAQINGLRDLAGELKTTPSELRNMRDDEFRGRIDRIRTALLSIKLSDLAAYNVTQQSIDAADLAFDQWRTLQSTVRQAIALRESATQEIATRLPELQTFLLERLDPLIAAIAPLHENFAAQYEIVREIVDPATQTRALTVTVRQLIDGDMVPVTGVEALINPGGLAKTTAEEGQFYVQTLAPGAYTLTLSKPGYASPAPLSFTITDGEMTRLPVTMVKA